MERQGPTTAAAASLPVGDDGREEEGGSRIKLGRFLIVARIDVNGELGVEEGERVSRPLACACVRTGLWMRWWFGCG